MVEYLRRRDKRLCLDVDSSALNLYIADSLYEAFPDARFIATIRDAYSWVDSTINHQLVNPDLGSEKTRARNLHELRFKPGVYEHGEAEAALKRRGLFTLDGYFSNWSEQIKMILSANIPRSRLMIVKLGELTAKAPEIVEFANLSRYVRVKETRFNITREKFHVLREVPVGYIEAKVKEHCGELMSELFPEIKSIADAQI